MKKTLDIKKLVLLNMPYILMGLFATNFGEAWRMAQGADASEKFLSLVAVLPGALQSFWPSLHPLDLLVGLCCGAGLRLAVYLKSKNAKKYRHGLEYGSARWGTREDIAPYVDPVFQNNVILTKTESLTMNSRPKDPKTARNKNVLVIGGSGSGKTRFWLKPNLMQMHSCYVVTDPKGTILVECGKMLQRGAPKLGKDGKPMKDTDTPYLTVRRAWHTESNRPVILDELKTKAAERNIPLPICLADCLREAKANSTSEYVVPNRDGDPLSYTQFKRLWQYIVTRTTKERVYYRYEDGKRVQHTVTPVLGEKAAHNGKVVYSLDFEVTPHQLRHTYITNLIHSSVDPKTVQYLAGHESSKITMDIYAKVKYNRPDELVKSMGGAFAQWDGVRS